MHVSPEPTAAAASGSSRGRFLTGSAAACAALLSVRVNAGAQNLKKIMIAEPVHQIGYLPLYMAIDLGLFAKRGLDVSTLTASGGAHVSALVSGQVWGNIGGPESDAMANGNGNGNANPLISICNVVNRANNYMVARKGLAPKSSSTADVAAMMKGKKIALNRFGGTPDILGRWYIEKVGLNLTSDVSLINNGDTSATNAMVKQGVADIAVVSEPQITAGREQGIWDEPYFGFPSLGEYTYSVISVKKATIASDPATVQAFVDAMIEGLKIATSRTALDTAAHKAFPTLADSAIKGALDRSVADSLWSKDGFMSEKGYLLDMSIVAKSGEFNKTINYGDVIDNTFVKKHKA
jgi:NitT/TauT family transport system substrate-binding protein